MQLLCNHPPAISSSPAVTPCLWWESRVSRTDHDVLNHVDSMGTPLEEAPAPVPSPPSLPHMSEVNGEIPVIDFISLNRGGLLKFKRLLVLCGVLLVKWTQSLCSWESSSSRKSPANPLHPPSLPSTHPPILHYTHNYIFTTTQHARSHACAHTACHCRSREVRDLTCFPRDRLFIIKNEDTTTLSLLLFSPEAWTDAQRGNHVNLARLHWGLLTKTTFYNDNCTSSNSSTGALSCGGWYSNLYFK